MYEKKIEAPFQHKIAEPWDPKYCNAPDKLGIDTRERYEKITRSDNYKVVFQDYFFYLNAFDPSDRNNPKDSRILPNHHPKLQNGIPTTSRDQQNNKDEITQREMFTSRSQVGLSSRDEKVLYSNNNFSKEINNNYGNSMARNSSQVMGNSNNFKKIEGQQNDIKVLTNIDSKFSKIKQMSNSGSASSLLRQYRVSGISSYGGGGNRVTNFSNIMSQNKSLIGSNPNSNNSTSTTNQNNYNVSSNSNQGSSGYMRKSGSVSYMGK